MVKVSRTILLASTFYFLIFSTGNAKTLEQELDEVNKLRDSEKTPFEQAENMCDKLLKKYTKPEEHARIYYQLAVIYSQNEKKKPDKIIEFSKKALELPLDSIERLTLYVWWGDAIQTAHRGVRNQDLVVARRKAVMPYLNGLKESLSIQYPKYTQPENLHEEQNVKTDSFDNLGPILRRRKAEQRKALYEWKKARFEKQLNKHKRILTDQISYMYSRFPWASDEIRELATKILEDEAAAEQLMSAVDAAVQQRKRELGLEPELIDINSLVEPVPPDANSHVEQVNEDKRISWNKEFFIPTASIALKERRPFVLDLADGKLLNPAAKVDSEEAYNKLMKLGKGDIAWEGFLVTLRKAEALTVSLELHRPLKFTASKWTGSYTLPNKVELPYTFVVRDREKRNYLFRIFEIQSNGIKINYKMLESDETKRYLPTEKKTK